MWEGAAAAAPTDSGDRGLWGWLSFSGDMRLKDEPMRRGPSDTRRPPGECPCTVMSTSICAPSATAPEAAGKFEASIRQSGLSQKAVFAPCKFEFGFENVLCTAELAGEKLRTGELTVPG